MNFLWDGWNYGFFVIFLILVRNGFWLSEVFDFVLLDILFCGSSFLVFVKNYVFMLCSYRWFGFGWMEVIIVWRIFFLGVC